MKTGLHELFRHVATSADGTYDPVRKDALLGDGYDQFIAALKSSPATKLRSRILCPAELWSLPAVGLLLADTLILTGWEDGNAVHRTKKGPIAEIQVLTEPEETKGMRFPDRVPGFASLPAFASFPSKTLTAWLNDARPFIDDGRLLYLPQRVIIELPIDGDVSQTSIEDVPADSPWELWRSIRAADAEGSRLLIPESVDGYLEAGLRCLCVWI